MGSTCEGLISVKAACRKRSVSTSSATFAGEARAAAEELSPGACKADGCGCIVCSGLDLLSSRRPTGLARCEELVGRPAELGRGPR